MTISTNGTGIRPGVVTSTTRPSSPYEGMMIFETDTNRVLIWDNAAWVMIADTDTPPGLQLITKGTLSTATTNVVDCFTDEFRNYRVVIGGITASAAADMWLKFFTTGTSFPAGNNYYYMFRGLTSGGGAVDTSSQAYQAGYTGWSVSGTGGQGSTVMDIMNPKTTDFTTVSCHAIYLGSGVYVTRVGGFAWDTGATFTGFQITSLTTATFNGSYSVYGYRN